MLNQQTQSMTKTKIIMDTVNSSVCSGSKEKMGASATTNNSSTSNAGGSSSSSITASSGKNNESGSPNIYQPGGAENLPNKLLSVLPAITQCTYTSCYCEENVWKLVEDIQSKFPSELEFCHVAFISNKKRMVPMWRQKAGKNEEKLALWDYHVILFYQPDERCVVYDMDSDLPYPTHFHRYVSETFRTENILQPEYHRFFRIIPASKFISLFSCDRSHMLKPDKTWIKPPPNYPPICKNGVNNLEQFIDMTNSKNEYGEIFTLMELVRKFYKPRQLS